ncbi:TonB-dependent receptor [Sediminibacterium goheungense]|uniref:Carboxypeptidase family protein n=1 Tax=Sediminibacterium goheungense TaxID=1086393 RepID=A0A4V3C527_9BACT|nr:carboxypeptidase-like regulatory domain-containing protein [Sediminibacterium goheungense]TDO28238.1 carboxypeptidase family protein [Sediminibacterium goheungense]
MRLLYYCFALICTLILSAPVAAQIKLSGTVKDAAKKPLSSASITLTKKGKPVILAFAITNSSGSFSLQYNGSFQPDSFLVNVSAINFKKQQVALKSADETFNFSMETTVSELPTVTVQNKKPLVRLEGDTLHYDVASFADKSDRVIGDVIKKLPGVEMDETGKITYLGKPITHLYIDGDNLLDGRYNIATRTIPSDMVSKIEVLENHQAVKSLKGIVPSDNPAMNLVLKDKARIRLIGDGNIAVGTPSLVDGSMNLMLFKKEVKFINYYKYNNTGVDLETDLVSHSIGFSSFRNNDNSVSPNLLSMATAGTPDLSRRRYLFNNTGLLNINKMLRISPEATLRINGFFLHDVRNQSYRYNATYFLPGDTIRYSEFQDNRNTPLTYVTQLNLNVNKSNYFLNNTLLLEHAITDGYARMQTNVQPLLTQQLKMNTTTFSNDLRYNKVINGKHVVEIGSYISNRNNPQDLTMVPGLYNNLLNNSIPYDQLKQSATEPVFYTDNFLMYRRKIGAFAQSLRAGFNWQSVQMQSVLQTVQTSGVITAAPDSFYNNLSWNRYKVYVEAGSEWNTKNWNISVNLPFSYQEFRYKNQLTKPSADNIRFIPFTPSFRALWKMNNDNEVSAYYYQTNSRGNVNEAFEGYLLQNYRNFIRNDATLSTSITKGSSLYYAYRNAIKLFFLNAGIGYIVNNGNSGNDAFLSDEVQIAKRILFDYETRNLNANLRLSKYLFKLRTTIGAAIMWQKGNNIQLQNGNRLDYESRNTGFTLTLNSKLSNWMNLGYQGSLNLMSNQQKGLPASAVNQQLKIRQLRQNAEVNVTPGNKMVIRFKIEDYFNETKNVPSMHTLFLDAAITFKFKKLKSDIELSCFNLAGNDSYVLSRLSVNSLVESSYPIRPRMFLLKTYFRF